MTPLQLKILVHFHYTLAGLPELVNPEWQRQTSELVVHELLTPTQDTYHYELTQRGKMFIQMILETPLPQQAWIDPRKTITPMIVEAVPGEDVKPAFLRKIMD